MTADCLDKHRKSNKHGNMRLSKRSPSDQIGEKELNAINAMKTINTSLQNDHNKPRQQCS